MLIVHSMVMKNRAPPLEETPEVLQKIHLRILFPPEEKKTSKPPDYRKFFIFFY